MERAASVQDLDHTGRLLGDTEFYQAVVEETRRREEKIVRCLAESETGGADLSALVNAHMEVDWFNGKQ